MSDIERGKELEFLYDELRRGSCHPLYLFHGEVDFFIEKAMNAVKRAALKAGPKDFNFNQFYAKETDIQKVIESANILPMMAPRRLVILRDADEIKEAALEKLVKYAEKPSPMTTLILVGSAMGSKKKLVAAVRKNGLALEFKPLYERELRPWLRAEVREAGRKMGEDGISFLMERVGDNLQELHNELEKLILYVGSREAITQKDLEAVVSDTNLEKVFELNEALSERDASRAVLQLRRLFEHEGDSGMMQAQATLYKHALLCLKLKQQLSAGVAPREAALAAGVQPNLVWKWEKGTIPNLTRRTHEELERQLQAIYQTGLQLRSSRVPKDVLLEAMVLRLCR